MASIYAPLLTGMVNKAAGAKKQPTIYAPPMGAGVGGGGSFGGGAGPTIYAPPVTPMGGTAGPAGTLNNSASVLDLVNAKMGATPSRVVSVMPNGAGQQTVGMGGGGAGGGIDVAGILAKMEGQYAAANSANEARYNKLLKLAQGYGKTQTLANQQQTAQQQASAASSLTSRGLGNSTIVDSVKGGIARAGQARQTDIDERVMQNQAGIIERRTDEQPNLAMYLQLLQRAGAMGGGAKGVSRLG